MSDWVAVKELCLSYYIGGTLSITIYIPIMATLFKFLNSNPGELRSLHSRLQLTSLSFLTPLIQ